MANTYCATGPAGGIKSEFGLREDQWEPCNARMAGKESKVTHLVHVIKLPLQWEAAEARFWATARLKRSNSAGSEI